MADKEFLKNVSMDQFLNFMDNLEKEKNNPSNPKTKEHYINKTAAELLIVMGSGNKDAGGGLTIEEAYAKNYMNSDLQKGIGDYTGSNAYLQSTLLFNRNDDVTGPRAKEFWSMIRDTTRGFFNGITMKSGDELTYPIDIIAGRRRNGISTVRQGTQPTAAQKKDRFAKFGKELFALHYEDQFDLKEIDILNNAWDVNFVPRLEAGLITNFRNDLYDLWTNGTSDDFSAAKINWDLYNQEVDFYRLGIGWLYNLMTANGRWTNSVQNTIVIGAFGHHVTATKVRIPATGTVVKYNPSFATTDGWVDVGDVTISAVASKLRLTKGAGGAVTAYAAKRSIAVRANTVVTVDLNITGGHATSSSYVEVYDQSGNVKLASSEPVVGVTETPKQLKFSPNANTFIELRFFQTTDSQTADFADLFVKQYIAETSGSDIVDVLDDMIDSQKDDYLDPNQWEFEMSRADISKYAKYKSSPVQIEKVTGTAIGVNTDTREGYIVKGEIPNHRGYSIVWQPYYDSVDKTTRRGDVDMPGAITLAKRADYWGYTLDNIQLDKEPKPRSSTGGRAIEYTRRVWQDSQTAPNERFCIAYMGAKCEIPVIMVDDGLKSTEVVSGVSTAAAGMVAWDDTFGADVYASKTLADLEDLETVKTKVEASSAYKLTTGVSFSDIDANTWYFKAFKEVGGKETLDASTVKTVTFA